MKKFKPYLITAAVALAVIVVLFRFAPEKARTTLLGASWA